MPVRIRRHDKNARCPKHAVDEGVRLISLRIPGSAFGGHFKPCLRCLADWPKHCGYPRKRLLPREGVRWYNSLRGMHLHTDHASGHTSAGRSGADRAAFWEESRHW